MGQEIERKFLLKNDEYKNFATAKRIAIKQGYLTLQKNKVIRIRIADEKAMLTLKGLASKITRHEFEYEIPLADAREMLDLFAYQPLIEKTRYKIHYQGKIWEVDEFKGANKGLRIAEIELDNEDDEFTIPDFVGEEVTEDKRYYNFNLVKKPYQEW